jgi:hypothetical protein
MAAIEAVSVFVIRISMSVGLAASLCGWCACMQMRKATTSDSNQLQFRPLTADWMAETLFGKLTRVGQ